MNTRMKLQKSCQLSISESLSFKKRNQVSLPIKKYQLSILSIKSNTLQYQLQIYKWRMQTNFPIIKIQAYNILQTKNDNVLVQIRIIDGLYSLQKINDGTLNVNQLIFLVKEVLVGYERLINKFGRFKLNQQMIVIDHKHRCQIWINQNFSLNHTNQQYGNCQIDQKRLYIKAIQIIQRKTLKSTVTEKFYNQLKASNNFIDYLKFIDDYTKKNMIRVQKIMIQKVGNKKQPHRQVMSTVFSPTYKPRPTISPFKTIDNSVQKNMRQTFSYIRNFSSNSSIMIPHKNQKQSNTLTYSHKTFNYKKGQNNKIFQMINKIPENQTKAKYSPNKQKKIIFQSKNKNILQASSNLVRQPRQRKLIIQPYEKKSVIQPFQRKTFGCFQKRYTETKLLRRGFGSDGKPLFLKVNPPKLNLQQQQPILQVTMQNQDQKTQRKTPFQMSNKASQLTLKKNSIITCAQYQHQFNLLLSQPTSASTITIPPTRPTSPTIKTISQHKQIYGEINDQPEQLTFQQIQQNYRKLGWIPTMKGLIHKEQEEMKRSVYIKNDKDNQQKRDDGLGKLNMLMNNKLNDSFDSHQLQVIKNSLQL